METVGLKTSLKHGVKLAVFVKKANLFLKVLFLNYLIFKSSSVKQKNTNTILLAIKHILILMENFSEKILFFHFSLNLHCEQFLLGTLTCNAFVLLLRIIQ